MAFSRPFRPCWLRFLRGFCASYGVRLALILLLLLPLAAPAAAVAVTGAVRVAAVADGVIVRLALSESLTSPPSSFALAHPWRLAIDLDGASSLQRQFEGAGSARAVRMSQFDSDTVRLVIDLTAPMQLVSAEQGGDHVLELRLKPIDEASFRRQVAGGRQAIIAFVQKAPKAVPATPPAAVAGPPGAPAPGAAVRLDAVEQALAEVTGGTVASAPAGSVEPVPPPAVAAAPPPPPPAPVVTARSPRKSRYVVVLDAGHGGTDPGAPSVHGGAEKTITLAIVKAAAAAVERDARRKGLNVDVRLTRDADYFVRLGTRVRRARDWRADLFISVHADSAANRDARGASVYTLSETASDSMAARLAAKENRADLIAGVDLSGENREVANILVDIGMRDSMNASADFAEVLQHGLQPKGVLFRSQFHRYANFQVLRNLGVPAVLLETGYLSNSEDARYLASARGQRAIADGIADAVVRYLSR